MNASGKPLDLRIRRTYKYLWEALINLMVERDFESITVTDICERAMVHRTTFYKHYEDKYGLLYHGIQDQLNLLFEDLNLPAGQPADMTEEASAVERLTAMFMHVEKQERFYRLMLCGNGIGKFYTLFRKSLVNHFLKRSDAHGRRELLTRSTYVPIPMQACWLAPSRGGWIIKNRTRLQKWDATCGKTASRRSEFLFNSLPSI